MVRDSVRRLARRLWRHLPEGRPLPAASWRHRHRGILVLLWLHVPGLLAVGLLAGRGLAHSLADVAAVAAAAALAGWPRWPRRARATLACFGLITASAALVHLSGGYIEMHFHFFVMVIVIALYQEWLPFLVAVGYVAVHHGLGGLLFPAAVYNHPDAVAHPWKWAAIHAAFVLAACAAALVGWRPNEAARAHGELLLHSAGEGILGLDATGRVAFANPAAAALLGYPLDALPGQPLHALLGCTRPDGTAYAADTCPVCAATPDDDGSPEAVVLVRRRDGQRFPAEAARTPVHERGAVTGAVVTLRDISARRQAEAALRRAHAELERRVTERTAELAAANAVLHAEIAERQGLERRLAYHAFHDALTDLPNRALFLDRLEHAVARAARHGDTLAVLFLDLDGFKLVNDSLGHAAGDQLLVAVAERLRGCLSPEDTLARLGGDEFTILLETLNDGADAVRVAERLTEELAEPFTVRDRELFVGASIGIALRRAEHVGAADLLREADTAMYRAKAAGKARYEVFDPSMNGAAVERLALETDLRHALGRGEFVLHYQPVVELASGRVTGVEARVRWQHPTRGLVPPARFIPLAEETGLILPLGHWVLAEACRQVRNWQTRQPAGPPLMLSVNLSARQFVQPDLAAEVAGMLRASGLPPASLRLEITESVLMAEPLYTSGTLQALKGLGVELVIDDFGTGYSSLGYLQRLPVDMLKIDKSFVAELAAGGGDGAIVQVVIALAHSLGLGVTAEGVEQAEQLGKLRALGCGLGQGFYFAKPLPAAAAEALVTHQPGVAPRPSTLQVVESHHDTPVAICR